MDELRKIISNLVEQKMKEAAFIKTMPCVVVDKSDDKAIKVTSVATGASYVVPNYSGSQLENGETVQLFYKGNIALNSNAYIGASPNKGESGGGGTDVNYIIETLESLVSVADPKTIDRMLEGLVLLKTRLSDNLNEKGVESDSSEKYNTLVEKVSQIQTGLGAKSARAVVEVYATPIELLVVGHAEMEEE